MQKICLSLILIALLFVSSAPADHLPENLLARGKPEKILAGIHLARTKLSDIIKTHGEPSKIEDEDYYWEKDGWTLHLNYYRSEAMKGGYINLIEIEGANVPRQIAATGRGLRLGDTIPDIRRIYGKKFKERKIPEYNIHDVSLQWIRANEGLVVVLDEKGRIKKLSLFAGE